MKDHTRDYSTEAFRFYARNGMSSEKYKQIIYQEALAEQKKIDGGVGISKPTEAAIIKAEKAVNDKVSEILDMEAVDKVLAQLQVKCRIDIIKAIEFVYFKDAERELFKGDIQERVIKASLEIHASERSIYNWLKQSRKLFAYKRGLRN